MTVQEVKKTLSSAREAERAYRIARDKTNAYKQLLMGGKSINYENDGSKSEKQGNSTENAYVMLAEYEEALDECLGQLVEARRRVEEYINLLSLPSEREVVTRFYVNGEKLSEIADKMHYSEPNVYRLKKNAIIRLQQIG